MPFFKRPLFIPQELGFSYYSRKMHHNQDIRGMYEMKGLNCGKSLLDTQAPRAYKRAHLPFLIRYSVTSSKGTLLSISEISISQKEHCKLR